MLTLSSIVFAAGLLTLGVAPTPPLPASAPTRPDEAPARAMVLLAFAFAATWIISTAMAAHLPNLLHLAGASTTAAVAAAALVGPAQVAARLAEFAVLRKFHPLVSARVATLLHPAGAALLAVFGAPAAAGFAVLHGVGNGMLTIAKGTLPLALFGPAGYGLRSGILSAPARIARPPPRWASHGRWNAGASGHSGSR